MADRVEAARIRQWVDLLALAGPGRPLAACFITLRPAHLKAEHKCLQALFERRQARQLQARYEVRVQQRLAERAEAAEQARFDAQWQARDARRQEEQAAHQALEREAARDDGWQLRHRVTRGTESAGERAAREWCGHETFALAGHVSCAELGRSDLDLLGDLAVPIPGFRSNAHTRRRAFFARIPASPRSVSLAHGRAA